MSYINPTLSEAILNNFFYIPNLSDPNSVGHHKNNRITKSSNYRNSKRFFVRRFSSDLKVLFELAKVGITRVRIRQTSLYIVNGHREAYLLMGWFSGPSSRCDCTSQFLRVELQRASYSPLL